MCVWRREPRSLRRRRDNGQVVVRFDATYVTLGDDGESFVYTRYAQNGTRYVIRKDVEGRELEAYAIRPVDPD